MTEATAATEYQAPAWSNGLRYVGDEGTVSVYHLKIENRTVLHVLVDNTDPDLRIGYRAPLPEAEVHYRNGHAKRELVYDNFTGDEKLGHITSGSVREYLDSRRVIRMLADVYVGPVENVNTDPSDFESYGDGDEDDEDASDYDE